MQLFNHKKRYKVGGLGTTPEIKEDECERNTRVPHGILRPQQQKNDFMMMIIHREV